MGCTLTVDLQGEPHAKPYQKDLHKHPSPYFSTSLFEVYNILTPLSFQCSVVSHYSVSLSTGKCFCRTFSSIIIILL